VAEGQLFEQLDVAKVSPFIVEKHGLAGFSCINKMNRNNILQQKDDAKSDISCHGNSLSYSIRCH
jgi:hypothetical protein